MGALLEQKLNPGELLAESRGLHGSLLILPIFFVVVGVLQFTPWTFAPGTTLLGWVALAYGLFTGVLFLDLYRYGRVGLTSQRLVYLQKTPFKPVELSGWDGSDFDAVMVRKGVFGSFLGYGHLLLLRSGRLVTVIRSVRDLETLVPKIESQLLKRGAA